MQIKNEKIKQILIIIFLLIILNLVWAGPIYYYMITGSRYFSSVLFFFGFFFYCLGWIFASKREMVSLAPLAVGMICMIIFPIVDNYHKLMIRFSDITIKTMLPIIIPALMLLISIIMLVIYLVNINNKKIQKIQRKLFLPSIALNFVSIILLIVILLN